MVLGFSRRRAPRYVDGREFVQAPERRPSIPSPRRELAILLRPASRWGLATPVVLLLGCGFRSGTIGDIDWGTGSTGTDDLGDSQETRENDSSAELDPEGGTLDCSDASSLEAGTCERPLILRDDGIPIAGVLPDCGPRVSEGWCSDVGRGLVYAFEIPYSRDVTIELRSDAFSPVLQVIKKPWDVDASVGFACKADPERDHRVCGEISENRREFAFFASKNITYYVVVGSAQAGRGGTFELTASIGATAEITACEDRVEDWLALDASDEIYLNGEFAGGQGHMANWCGGAGTEQIYGLEIHEEGRLQAWVQAESSVSPLVTLQSACDSSSILGVSEQCNAWGVSSNNLAEPVYVERGDFVYLVVDHLGIDGGDYAVMVELEN